MTVFTTHYKLVVIPPFYTASQVCQICFFIHMQTPNLPLRVLEDPFSLPHDLLSIVINSDMISLRNESYLLRDRI